MSTETALSYAALILADADVEITSEKLSTLVQTANVAFEPIWADLFARALEGNNLKDVFFNFSAAPAASVGGAGAAAGGASEEVAAEEKEEESKEESDDDMGFGLFD